ncbi:MAG TPA: hypothetical protein VJS37_16015 [Terriglobales bacterium]|nr:hypothetical protein [Terriglobales bacterium]
MAIVVVGGHSRNIGKTSVVVGLIGALAEYNWTAFKITQFGHGQCSLNGEPCDCAPHDRCWAITEEQDKSGRSDSSRFLVAGAKRAFWVRTEQGRLEEALPAIQRKIAAAENVIIESNSILRFMDPDLYITVLDPSTEDFKGSAQRYLSRADAVVLHQNGNLAPQWKEVTAEMVQGRPVFQIAPPAYVTSGLVGFVANRLPSTAHSPSR